MKGCIAIWIVWSCFLIYERFFEILISIFVPFYDEIKSLALLFLILTRARGAEPLFLHVIRPLVKPYTPTIDMLLDLARMFGDIFFTVLEIPGEYIYGWWRTSMFYTDEVLDSEVNSPQETASPSESINPAVGDIQFPKIPRKISTDTRSSTDPNESDRKPSRSFTRIDKVGQGVHSSATLEPHQIWYPPPSYSDEEDTEDPSAGVSEHMPITDITTQQQKAFDEWRKYPPFPSAYPPTPIVLSEAVLPGTGAAAPRMASSLMLSEILEDTPQQDFSGSLMSPRQSSSPGIDDDMSDDDLQSPGAKTNRFESMSVDSGSDDDYEDEEDVFNTTLQTPMPPLRLTRSGVIPVIPMQREVSLASSVASRSTALTSNANGSSLRTQSSAESLPSEAHASDLSSVLGKKRPLPRDIMDRNKVRTAESLMSRTRPRSKHTTQAPSRRSHLRPPKSSRLYRPGDVINEETESTYSSPGELNVDINGRKLTSPKRRKVILSPVRTTTRPARPRVARLATAPPRALIPKVKVPLVMNRRSYPMPSSAPDETSSANEINAPAIKRTTRPKAQRQSTLRPSSEVI